MEITNENLNINSNIIQSSPTRNYKTTPNNSSPESNNPKSSPGYSKLQKTTSNKSLKKPSPVDTRVAYLKNNRIDFYEKKWDLSRHPLTISELALFFQHLSDVKTILAEFPEKFEPLIAKIIQDSSLSDIELVKYVLKHICPMTGIFTLFNHSDSSKIIESDLLLKTIHKIASRTNYGIDLKDKAIKNLSIWRWEVNNDECFPNELLETLHARRIRRNLAKEQLNQHYQQLSSQERDILITCSENTKKQKELSQERRLQKEAKLKERESKNAEKELKLAEKESKRIEKERKENEKRIAKDLEESAKKKKEQAQKSISGFFSPVSKKTGSKFTVNLIDDVSEYKMCFSDFYVRENVQLPVTQKQHSDVAILTINEKSYDEVLNEFVEFTVSKELSTSKMANENDCILVEEAAKIKFKLLQFADDVRPPYFGTWTKKSKKINGRNPLAHDSDNLDYDIDSEAEWEEDEIGEELKSEDECEDEESQLEEGEDIDGWVVPHGYLSDDEGIEADHQNMPDKNEMIDLPKRAALKPLIPILVGIHIGEPDSVTSSLLSDCSIFLFGKKQSIDPYELVEEISNDKKVPKKPISKKSIFPEEHIQYLKEIMLGFSFSITKIVDDFKLKFPEVKKITIEQKIKEIAVKEKRGPDMKSVWHLKEIITIEEDQMEIDKTENFKSSINEDISMEDGIKSNMKDLDTC